MQLAVQAFKDCNNEVGWTGYGRQKEQEEKRDDAEVVRIISTFPGPVVSDDMTALLRNGKSVPFEPAIVKQTTDTHIFDENPLIEKISAGFFDAFVLTNPAYAYTRSHPARAGGYSQKLPGLSGARRQILHCLRPAGA